MNIKLLLVIFSSIILIVIKNGDKGNVDKYSIVGYNMFSFNTKAIGNTSTNNNLNGQLTVNFIFYKEDGSISERQLIITTAVYIFTIKASYIAYNFINTLNTDIDVNLVVSNKYSIIGNEDYIINVLEDIEVSFYINTEVLLILLIYNCSNNILTFKDLNYQYILSNVDINNGGILIKTEYKYSITTNIIKAGSKLRFKTLAGLVLRNHYFFLNNNGNVYYNIEKNVIEYEPIYIRSVDTYEDLNSKYNFQYYYTKVNNLTDINMNYCNNTSLIKVF